MNTRGSKKQSTVFPSQLMSEELLERCAPDNSAKETCPTSEVPISVKSLLPVSNPGSCKSFSSTSRRSSAALKAFRVAQLREQRVRQEVELKRAILDAQDQTELAKIELEADEDSTDENWEPACPVSRVADYLRDCKLSERPKDLCPQPKPSFHQVEVSSPTHPVMLPSDLPKVELIYFDGSPTQYWKFIRQFQVYIESKVYDAGQRLLYLTHYCRGDARAAIEECVMLPPGEAYAKAREILQDLFGQPHSIARSLLDELFKLAKQTTGTAKSLSDLAIKMRSCAIALTQMQYVSDLHSLTVLERIVQSLPSSMQHKWAEVAHQLSVAGREPNFSDLTQFVDTRSRIARSRFGQLAREGEGKRSVPNTNANPARRENFRTFLTQVEPVNSLSSPHCVVCAGRHNVVDCHRFILLTVPERWNCLKERNVCFLCFEDSHRAKDCRIGSRCGQAGCNGRHHRLLHLATMDKSLREHPQANVACALNRCTQAPARLGVIPVKVHTPMGAVPTYAFLDSGSNVTLVRRRFLERNGVALRPTSIAIDTLSGSLECISETNNLRVFSLNGFESIKIDKAFVVNELPMRAAASIKNTARRWPHLKDIPFDELVETQIDILIGTDVTEAFWIFDQRLGGKKQPFGVKTLLGWMLVGPLDLRTNHGAASHCMVGCDPSVDDCMKRLYNCEFSDTSASEVCLSVDDQRALEIMRSSIIRVSGHYQLPLPWKCNPTILPNNLGMARKRLASLKVRLLKDPSLLLKYDQVLRSYMDKGYIERVIDFENTAAGKHWYLPHHPVINPRKPEKIRVVFDCAAKYLGASLNDHLYQGPDLTAKLVTVLLGFRLEQIAVAADIEEMFLQVKVDPSHRAALKFLWWETPELMGEPVEFQWTSHPFGVTSSPFCASFALHETVKEFGLSFSAQTRDAITSSIYVDDCLKSLCNPTTAKCFVNELCTLLVKGGFRMRNWASNDRSVLSSIAVTERASGLRNITTDPLPIERTLGIQWDTDSDTLLVSFNLPERPSTRRGILSCLSSLYDPLGFVSPWLVPGKSLLQSLCRVGLGWDEPLNDADRTRWEDWLMNLRNLDKLRLPRCLKPPTFTDTSLAELHVFCDASESAYSVVAYARFVRTAADPSCSLVYSKARVAPLKSVSIPRLELTAASLAVRVAELIRKSTGGYFTSTVFWTDSMIVLYYIHNVSSRFSTFVANRLTMIHDLSSVTQWRHVTSEDNPADIASRGTCSLSPLYKWLNGPNFLNGPENIWPAQPLLTLPEGLELKRSVAQVHVLTRVNSLYSLITKYSNWVRLLKAIVWLLRFKQYVMISTGRAKRDTLDSGVVRVSELHRACADVLKMVQSDQFSEEVELLRSANSRSSSQRLQRLCPVLIDGLLCVGGRLNYSSHSQSLKHPVILPSRHPVTELIIRHFHEIEGHCGTAQVLASIRQKYWILKGAATVKRVVGSCPACRRRSAHLGKQMMAPLPIDRVEAGWYPFKCVGTDYFGPFKTKRGRTHEKRYGCIFTCLQTRAVHLEMAHSLSTDSFLQCLTRFVGRRGKPTDIYSDNGTNFVGALAEFKNDIKRCDQKKVSDSLLTLEIQWHFNPPAASHRGGVWERMIRSVRRILLALCKEQILTDEQLCTLFVQAERIINNRPLLPQTSDCNDLEPLTPNSLLLMRTCPMVPSVDDVFNRYRAGWRQVHYLAGIFWQRWIKEYLPTLQVRTKWLRSTQEIKPGDMVLVSGDATPREHWPLGVVDSCETSSDGLVRTVSVKTAGGVVKRDVRRIALLEGGD